MAHVEPGRALVLRGARSPGSDAAARSPYRHRASGGVPDRCRTERADVLAHLFVLRSIFASALDDGLIVGIRRPSCRRAAPPKQRQATGAQRGRPRHAARACRGRSARRGVVVDVAGLRPERNPRAHMGGCGLERRYGHGLTLDHSGRFQTSSAPTGTKTRSGARCLPLAGGVVAVLSTLRAEHGAALDSNTSDRDSSRSMRTACRYVPGAGRTCGGRTARRQACPWSPCTALGIAA